MVSGTKTATSEEVLTGVAQDIRALLGPEFVLPKPISMETSFSADLDLESIEFVALAERLAERYGAPVDFGQWLSGMDLDQIIGLTVGDVVDYVVTCLSSRSTG